jgi:S-adenosylmethionine decarboxylase
MFQFFEGSEKKVEIAVRPGFLSLRKLGEETWRRVLARARADIISRIADDACDAYLLSESSLFVFDHRMILITCGRTTLVEAVNEVLRFIPLEAIRSLIYERKNELFPEYQPSNFFDDARVLKEKVPGRAYRFGDEDDHHIHLFHLDRAAQPDPEDTTLEILMHGIDPAARAVFCSGPDHRLENIHSGTRVREILPGFQVDDHLFEPVGYSLNAIRGGEYYTVHVTPQETGSYVSFETNHFFRNDLEGTVRAVLDTFRPKSCDLLFFFPGGGFGAAGTEIDAAAVTAGGEIAAAGEIADGSPVRCGYELKRRVRQRLDCGYEVRYHHFFRPQAGPQRAEELFL